MFSEYVEHGWRLVPLTPGAKRVQQRGWNQEAMCVTSVEELDGVRHAGLAHAYSGTCALDIDDIKEARKLLAEYGIDLAALYRASDAVRIRSGKKNRAKLLYALETPLASTKFVALVDGKKKNIIDFRCGTAAGLTVQDALPPSRHPETNKPYTWQYADPDVGHWSRLPKLPDAIRELWESRLREKAEPDKVAANDFDDEELQSLLRYWDPDTDYETWVHVGMAIHSATEGSEAGLAIWDEWSSTGEKYRGLDDLVPHWQSFRGSGITADYLLTAKVADEDVFDDLEASGDDEDAKPKKEPRFVPIRVDEWVQRPPPEWLIHGVLPCAEIAMMFGDPGSGKSFLALDMSMAVAGGGDWRDLATRQGPVLWIAAEAAGSVRNRALAYARFHDIPIQDLDLWIVGDTPSFNDVNQVRELAKHAKKIGPKLIVVDTMTAASGGANENSGEDMAVILAACRALHKITGGLIMLIHHSGKDKSRGARGWSGLKGAMQTEIEVTHEETGERKAKIVKQRDGEQDIEYSFRLAPVSLPDFDGVPQDSCAVDPMDSVTVASVTLHPGWANLALLHFLERGKPVQSRKRFCRTLEARAVVLDTDPDTVDASVEEVLAVLANSGRMLIDAEEIRLLPGGFEDVE